MGFQVTNHILTIHNVVPGEREQERDLLSPVMALKMVSSLMMDLGAGGMGDTATSEGGSTAGSTVEVDVGADSALATRPAALRNWGTLRALELGLCAPTCVHTGESSWLPDRHCIMAPNRLTQIFHKFAPDSSKTPRLQTSPAANSTNLHAGSFDCDFD